MGGIAVGPVVLLGSARPVARFLSDDPEAEQARLDKAVDRMQRGLDDLFADVPNTGRAADVNASREVLEAYRLVAYDAGWLRRVAEVIRSGMTAEAAVQRVASELHDKMRRISDAYLRERLADMEDLANRLLTALTGEAPRESVPEGAILLARRLGPARVAGLARPRHRRGGDRGSQPAGHAAILARALGIPAIGSLRGMLDSAEEGDDAVMDGDEGQFILRPETEVRNAYARAKETRDARYAELANWRGRPAATADGDGPEADAEYRP